MRNIKAVFKKQIISFFKNSGMFGMPMFFLGIPFAMLLLIPDVGENRHLIVTQFVIMFVGLAMVGIASGFIEEDRTTMNLRFMGMAGVKPYQYLIGTCGALLLVSLGALTLFGLMSGFSGQAMASFLTLAMLGAAASMLLGITLRLTRFAPFTPVVAMLLGVGPLFADANETLANIFSFTYTHRVNTAMQDQMAVNLSETFQVVAINIAIILVLFIIFNLRVGLDGEKISANKA